MSEQPEATHETPAPRKPARKKRTRHATPKPPKAMPEEFAGMTEFDCCNSCADKATAAAAQRRLNEIEAAYPRQASRNPQSQTVMESDGEWLARNQQIAAEFRTLVTQRAGCCYISGMSVCAHPFKGGLQTEIATPESIRRYERAKKALRNRKIDLTKGGV